MIDTDKYEGHTPASWMMGEYKGRPSIHAGDETFVRSIARGLNPSQTADHALLLDAPLLLAEVKRLREENDALLSAIDMCIVTQMNSVEHGFRYQSGGCFEHYSYWQHEKESEEE